MAPQSSALEKLHQLHLALKEVQEGLDRGPRLIANRQQSLDKRIAEVKSKQDQLKQLKMSADQKALQQKSNSSKISDLQSKLNAAANNREYDILKNQIAADTMANSVLDDEILEALDRIDAMQAEIRLAEEVVKGAQSELEKVTAQAKAALPGLNEQKEKLLAELSAAETFLPGDIVPTYRRLVGAHGASALSPIQNKSCSECYLGPTSQMLMELRNGKLHFCRNCGRLLYLPATAE